ncbi:acyl-CoA dehydrogenase family protein [Estrella lausannensis]|uniref:Acyl-CoA dehydrogenase n=1 Tax=Estrella lausannensis TaxID=483423 RepID=A0A0H5DTD0_9BACT|nr:acyl-CoA dehydrogenase family protein [Estrella lausannensis]CRX39084.1 hypothetical protein ELAC_1757 [Estrella lausannensis]
MDKDQIKMAEELFFSEENKPSAAKLLYKGVFDSRAYFPFPDPSPEEKKNSERYIASLKTHLDKHLDPVKIDKEAIIPAETIKKLAEIGLFGISVPKEHGGLGMSQYSYCKAIEEVASRCGSTAILINAHQSIGLKGILLFGNDAQKKRYLPPLAKGEQIAAFSLTEPNAGSDASGIETRAVFDPERKVYRISGRKQWTSNGSIASVLTLMAKTEVTGPKGKEDKVTAFIITPDMKGFKILHPGLEKVGIKGTRTTNLELTDLEVPEENILGPLGGGLKVCLTALDFGRTTFGAMCLGASKYCLERALSWSVERIQFRRPLASFSLVQKKLAEMAALTFALDATTYMTAGLIDQGQEDVMLESAMLKVFASESLWSTLYDTMQIFGGRSFFTDQPFERMMRDARLNMIGEGSNEVLRAFISAVGLREAGAPLKEALSSLTSSPFSSGVILANALKNLMGLSKRPSIPNKIALIEKECAEISRFIPLFSKVCIKSLMKYKEGVIEKQLLLNRLTNVAIALYTSMAVISRIQDGVQDPLYRNPEKVARFYLRWAIDTMRLNLENIDNGEDCLVNDLSATLTGK